MRKRRRQRRKLFIFLFVFSSFLFLTFSSAYAILNCDVAVHGNASLAIQNSSGGDFVEGIVDEDDGLVENGDGSLDFVGDSGTTVNNFIQIPGDDYLWRILSIDVDGNLKIIRNRDESLSMPFISSGGNARDWANTLILQNLKSWYQENLGGYSNIIVQNPEWLVTDAAKPGTVVNVLGTYTDSPIGLIRNDEIVNSSSTGASGQRVSSWLNDGYIWTMTYVKKGNKTDRAWRVNGDKFMDSAAINAGSTVARPVIYLKSSVMFSSGTGTESDPFVVKY